MLVVCVNYIVCNDFFFDKKRYNVNVYNVRWLLLMMGIIIDE